MLRKHRQIEVPDDDPLANDKLKRHKGVDTLSGLITTAQTPFVLAVNGSWGTGKTTFVRMVEATLRKQGHLCIHHNAWQNDFADDPLIGLVGELAPALDRVEVGAGTKRTIKNRLRKVQGSTKAFLHAVGPLALQVATRGALTSDDVTHDAEIIASSGDDIAKALSKSSEEALERHRETRKSIEGLRQQLADLVSCVAAENSGVL